MEAQSEEDYLRIIYLLHEEHKKPEEGVRSVDVAKALGISKPSVSAMVRKLADKGYVTAERYGALFLTKEGLKEGKRITRSYRIIRVFLRDVLMIKNTSVDEEAHRLEHAFSDESLKKIEQLVRRLSKEGRL